MPITRTPWVDDDGTGTTGTIINNAEKQTIYNQIDALVGSWQNVPFNAGSFGSTGGMTWTVGSAAIAENKYCLINKVLFWSIYVSWFSGSNVLGGTPNNKLLMTLPAGLLVATNQIQAVEYTAGIAGVAAVAGLYATYSGSGVQLQKASGGNFALSDIPGLVTTFIVGVL